MTGLAVPHANDNRAITASFTGIPELFLRTYSKELLGWASSLVQHGATLTIQLWNPPGATILSAGWQGSATLRCDVMANPVTGAVKMIISPESESVGRIRTHCEDLPKIMQAHRATAEANKGKPRGAVTAIFNLPEYFVERYGYELREWGRNLQKIGFIKHIVLREGTLSDASPDPEIGAVLLGVTLKAEIERLTGDAMRLVIGPATEMDERTVRNHCQKMQRWGIKAVAQLVEPERPGLPAVPNVVGPTIASDGEE